MTQRTNRAKPEQQFVEAFATFEHNGAAADPTWLRDLRRDAMGRFEELGFPTARRGNERWKYTDVGLLARSEFVMLPNTSAPAGTDRVRLEAYELPCPRVHQLTFVDGRYAPGLSTEPPSEAGIHSDVLGRRGDGPVVGRLTDAFEYRLPMVEEQLGKLADYGGHPFTALNTAFTHDGAFVFIPDGISVPEPIYLLFISTGAEGALVTHPRVLVIAGRNSSATVLQSFESVADGDLAYFTNAVTEVVAMEGSRLRLYVLQREGPAAFHLASTHASVMGNATLASATFDIGGGFVRRDLNVRLDEPGAKATLHGLFHGCGNRHVDNHVTADHTVPDTASKQVYKGILGDASHGVFAGEVLVRKDAQRTEAHQVTRNLLLSDHAAIDTQPKLEIYADDVQCTHGAAVGQLAMDAMFYLKSRGLDESQARALLVHGFAQEVIGAVEHDAVRQYLDVAIAAAVLADDQPGASAPAGMVS